MERISVFAYHHEGNRENLWNEIEYVKGGFGGFAGHG
jgi:hypothetical protein